MPPDSSNFAPELTPEERARIYAEEKARLENRPTRCFVSESSRCLPNATNGGLSNF